MEAWLRGPVDGVPPLLQPVAHMLLHTLDDAASAIEGLQPDEIWKRPGGGASVGFHIRHLIGALDRIYTYAKRRQLDDGQLAVLAEEASPGTPPADSTALLAELATAIERALNQIRTTDPATLLEARGVGRRQIQSTVLGLLVHGGEHSARHAGQALTLSRVVASADYRGEDKRR